MELDNVFDMFRREVAANSSSTADDNALSASFSSACNCQTYLGPNVTATYTHDPTVLTISAYDRSTTTVRSTTTDGTRTSTITVTAARATGNSAQASNTTIATTAAALSSSTALSATVIMSTSTSAAAATPTAPPFTCPDDNNQTISQLIGNERFDYRVYCDMEVAGPTLFGSLAMPTFSQCVAACSMADDGFPNGQPVCQGVDYFNSPNINGYNCFLKSQAGNLTMAVGVDTAILQRIAVGITNTNSAGTSTESAPFSGETVTMDPGVMSASLASMFQNNSQTVPIITPNPMPVSGRAGPPGAIVYSTFVSNGSTFSTGSVFSTYYTGNGSWYSSYYTSFTVAWGAAETVYATSETGTAVSNSSNSATNVQSYGDGGKSIISTTNVTTYSQSGNYTYTNITETIANNTFAANGTQIGASTTTLLYSYTSTGIAGSGSGSGAQPDAIISSSNSTSGNGTESGGAGGSGSGGSGAGSITPSAYTSTSYFSTQTVIVVSGGASGASGAEGSGVIQTPAPSVGSSVIINSYGSNYASGYAASGAISSNGTSGETGTAASGLITPTPISSGINSYGSAYGSGYAASGAISSNGTSGETGTAASGLITPTPISVGVNSYGTAYGSGFAASGAVSSNGTSGGSGTAVSGSFTNSPAPRSGTESTTSTPLIIETLSAPSGAYGLSSSSTTSRSFSNTGAPRSGTESTTSTIPMLNTSSILGYTAPPLLTAPASSGPPIESSNGTGTFSNTGAPRSGTVSGTLTPPAPYVTPAGTGSSGLPPALSNTTASPGPTGPSPYTPFSNTGAPRSGTESSSTLPGTGPVPYGTAPYPSGTGSFSNTGAPRSGTESSTTITGTGPIPYPPLSTGTGPAYPSTCANGTMGTTTMFVTTTMYGCYSTCYPQVGASGGYPGVQTFGPPVWPTDRR